MPSYARLILIVGAILTCVFLGTFVYGSGVAYDSASKYYTGSEIDRSVQGEPDAVRNELFGFMASAENERDFQPLKVDNMSDGSIRLLSGEANIPKLLITARLEPVERGRMTRVVVQINAKGLAARLKGTDKTKQIQRKLRDAFNTAFDAMDSRRRPPQGLRLSPIIAEVTGKPKQNGADWGNDVGAKTEPTSKTSFSGF